MDVRTRLELSGLDIEHGGELGAKAVAHRVRRGQAQQYFLVPCIFFFCGGGGESNRQAKKIIAVEGKMMMTWATNGAARKWERRAMKRPGMRRNEGHESSFAAPSAMQKSWRGTLCLRALTFVPRRG